MLRLYSSGQKPSLLHASHNLIYAPIYFIHQVHCMQSDWCIKISCKRKGLAHTADYWLLLLSSPLVVNILSQARSYTLSIVWTKTFPQFSILLSTAKGELNSFIVRVIRLQLKTTALNPQHPSQSPKVLHRHLFLPGKC